MNVGTLNIELAANVARIQKDMEQAQRSVSGAMSAIEKSVGVAKSALTGLAGGLAAGLSVGAFSAWIKGAVDAADAASKLSQRAGVAVKDIAGLQLAYQQAGLDTNVLAESTAKLAKGMADGNKALKAMGIQSKDTAGNFKSTTAVLYEVADAFEGMPDGIQKTALAVTLFGESGSKLLPLLNGGSEGMREMAEMAEKLGLTISEETARDAEAFNDTLELVGMGSRGVANGIAAQLLPTLSSLAGSFLESMTSGDKLKRTADFLASGLKILYTVGVGVVEVFSTIGKTIGAAGAQIVAILSGDFKLAAQIGREWSADMKNGWSDTAKAIAKAWDSSGNSAVETQAKLMATNRDYLGDLKKREEAEKAAAEATKKRAKEISDAEEKALKESMRRAEEGRKAAEAILKSYNDEAKRSIENAIKEAEQNERLAETFGMTKTQIEALELARLEEQLAQRSSLGLTLQEIETLEKLIEAKRRSVSAVGQYEAKDAARKAAEESAKEWQKSFDQISQSLTDAIMRGGKSAGEYLKDYFRTLVLRPIVQAIVNPIAGAAANMLGGGGYGGTMATASNAYGAANMLSTSSSLYTAGQALWQGFSAGGMAGGANVLGQIGSYGLTALSGGTAAVSTGAMGTGWVSAEGAAAYGAAAGGTAGTGVMGGISSALASIPVWGWILLAIIAFKDKLFGHKTVGSGIMGSVMNGDNFSGNLYEFQKGGWFRSDRTKTHEMPSELSEQLGLSTTTLKQTFDSIGMAIGAGTDLLDGYNYEFRLALADFDEAGKAKEVQRLMASMGDSMALAFVDSFRTSVNTAEQAASRYFTNTIDGQRSFGPGETVTKSRAASDLDVYMNDILRVFDAYRAKIAGKEGMEGALAAFTTQLFKFADGLLETNGYIKTFGEAVDFAKLEAMATGAETLFDTFDRLNTIFSATNSIAISLGQDANTAFGAVGVASTEARQRLIDLAGGIEALVSGSEFFAQNFLTEAERMAPVIKSVQETMASLGHTSVDTKDEFKALVQGLDLGSEAGAKLYAQLLAVAPAFAQVADYAARAADEAIESARRMAEETAQAQRDAAQAALDAAMQGVDTAFSTLQRAVDAERNAITKAHQDAMTAINTSIQTVNGNISKLSSLSNSLRSTIDRMRMPQEFGADRAAAQAQIIAALAIARTGGVLPDADSLSSALNVVSQPSEQLYSTFLGYQRDFLITRNNIRELADLTDSQLSIEQRTLTALQDQLKLAEKGYSDEMTRLDGVLSYAQQQVDILNGIDNSILSVAAAIAGLQVKLGAAATAQAAAATASGTQPNIIAGLYSNILGRTADAQGAAWWQNAIATNPMSNDQLTRDFISGAISGGTAQDRDNAIAYARANNIPGFAGGGWHMGGLRVVGEYGPEVEATGPARYYSASQTASMMSGGGNAELVAEVRSLRDVTARQQDALDKIEKASRKTTEILDRVTRGGVTIFTETE